MDRCFIVGNGVSLNYTDLSLLEGEHTFGVNRVHLLYRRTSWRPTYYVQIEGLHPMTSWDVAYHVNMGMPCFIGEHLIQGCLRHVRIFPYNLIPVNRCTPHSGMDVRHPNRPTSWHLPYVCHFGTTIGAATQIAYMLGYRVFIFVGCDLGFKRGSYWEGDPNHFDAGYLDGVDYINDHDLEYRDPTLAYVHGIIQQEADGRGCRVYNATVGGLLEVHERTMIEEVVNGQADRFGNRPGRVKGLFNLPVRVRPSGPEIPVGGSLSVEAHQW